MDASKAFSDFQDPREQFLSDYFKAGELDEITAQARLAVKDSYSPYSNFAVGACILSHSGEYVTGANIEGITLSLTTHAEGNAVSRALHRGIKDFKAIAVYAESEGFEYFITPCGECRQLLIEFCLFLPIILVHKSGETMIEMLHELLPLSFVMKEMKIKILPRDLNNYEKAIVNSNTWILSDMFAPTRNEMQQLIRDRAFDAINNIIAGTLIEGIKDDRTIRAGFGCGYNKLNPITCNLLTGALCNSLKEGKQLSAAVELKTDDSKLAVLLGNIVLSVLKTQDIPSVSEKSNLSEEKESLAVEVKLSIHAFEEDKETFIEIEITKKAGNEPEFLRDLIADMMKADRVTDISNFFDFRGNKLKF